MMLVVLAVHIDSFHFWSLLLRIHIPSTKPSFCQAVLYIFLLEISYTLQQNNR